MSVDELTLSYDLFLDKSTVLYGESKTGKSTIIIAILKHLKPHIDQVVVVCPSDSTNKTYSGGLIPPIYVHKRISDKLLDDLWNRQEAFGFIYKKANQMPVLEKLFNRCGNERMKSVLGEVRRKQEDYKHEMETQYDDTNIIISKVEEMKKECDKFLMLMYKKVIGENLKRLNALTNLTKDEKFAIKYIDFNPRLIVIFDDCSAELKKFQKHKVIQEIFYQGRHSYVTSIIACHSDKNLDSEFRKNAFVSIFTESKCARAYFNRPSNDYDKDDQKLADAVRKAVFIPALKHQKLVWIREDKKYYKLTAPLFSNFTFGCDAIWEFSKIVQNDGMTISRSNKFIEGIDL